MKKTFSIAILIFTFISACKAYSQNDTVAIPASLKEQRINIIGYNENTFTVSNKHRTSIWQFANKADNKFSLQFSFYERFHKEIYEFCFPGANEYENTNNALLVNGVRESLCKIASIYVNEKNEVFALVTGQLAKPTPEGDPKKDFTLYPFFTVIQIGNGAIAKIFYIPEPVVNSFEYTIFESGNFFINNDYEFVFTLIKSEDKKPFYFLGKWKADTNKKLYHSGLIQLELSELHKKNKLYYGLLNYVYHNGQIMFNITTCLYNTDTKTQIYLPVKGAPEPDISSLQYGGKFDIPFSVCDFINRSNTLSVLTRTDQTFTLRTYDKSTNQVIKETPIKIENNSLGSFPFFDSKGRIVIYYKASNMIVFYNYE